MQNEYNINATLQQQQNISARVNNNNIIQGNSTQRGPQGIPGVGISNISLTSSSGDVDTYTITLDNGDTYTFDVTNGRGIVSVVLTSSVGLIDTYTITYTDNTTSTFTVTNGQDGTDGQDGAAATITVGNVSTGAAGTSASIVNTGTTSAAVLDFTIPKGDKGDTGSVGATGTGVTSVTLQSTEGLANNYRMHFSDGNYYDYTVTNGASGSTQWGAISGTLSNQTDLSNSLNGLQNQIDAITSASDVTDIVGTYAELQAYDTTSLPNNSIIKVLQDENRNDETTYYRWVITGGVGAWVLIGEEGPYYTKSQSDSIFAAKTDVGNGTTVFMQDGVVLGTITANQTSANTIAMSGTTYSAGSGININGTTISTSTTIASKTDIGDGKTIFKKNGTAFATITANQTSTVNVDYTVPDTSSFANVNLSNISATGKTNINSAVDTELGKTAFQAEYTIDSNNSYFTVGTLNINNGGFTKGTNSIAVPTNGFYLITFSYVFQTNITGYDTVYLRKNGSDVYEVGCDVNYGACTGVYYTNLDTGDLIQLYSNSKSHANHKNYISIKRIGAKI